MVLLIPLITAIPTVIAVSEGAASQRRQNAGDTTDPDVEKAQMRKFTLECYCEGKGWRVRQVHGGKVVLRGGKLWVLPLPHPPSTPEQQPQKKPNRPSHTFTGFYISYPDPERPPPPPLGLVSTVTDEEPPLLNWIYVDSGTREVRYGNRTQSRAHVVGSWGWDVGDEDEEGEGDEAGGLTLEGEEGGVVRWTDADGGGDDDGGWEILWEGEGDRERVKGGLRVSFERRWVKAEGEEGEETGKKQEAKTEEAGKGKAKGKTYTETTFEVTQTTVGVEQKRKKKEKQGEGKRT